MDTYDLRQALPVVTSADPRTVSLRKRRLLLFVPSSAATLWFVALSAATLLERPHGLADWLLAIPFAAVMAWECVVVCQLVLGFWAGMTGSVVLSDVERDAQTVKLQRPAQSRTALIIPIFEEDPGDLSARIRVMWSSLARLGDTDHIVVHVLSDTREPSVAAAEEHHVALLQAGEIPSLRYRRRASNIGRKAGNVGDFLDREGDDYDFAIVLDADSLMSGACMNRLIGLMEKHDRVALIQTVSYAAGRETFFARMQQFAVRLHAPLTLRGLEFWQGCEGSFWGHNAIVRVAPFRQFCRLPVLPGRPPLGGEILCHDTVEAALLVRAGWDVRLLPELDGTWEEMPTNVHDLLGRERRWCQGNLQHMRLLGLPGLRAGSRVHIAFGIGGYLVAPLWWAFLLGGAARVLLADPSQGLGVLAYGWTETGAASLALTVSAAILILTPKCLNITHALTDKQVRGGFGGSRRLLAGAAWEQVLALLFGPVLFLSSAGFVLRTLRGKVVPWSAQRRSDRHVGWMEALSLHRSHVVLALVLLAACIEAGGGYAVWMAPSALGLLLSPGLTSLSSRIDLGRWSRDRGLFLTVDETAPARELTELQAAMKA